MFLLAVLAASLAPAHDIRSAGQRLAPPGARITLAFEADARFGVVAYRLDGRPAAFALGWRNRRWQRAQPGGLRIEARNPRPGTAVHEPTLGRIRFAGLTNGPIGLWLDGVRHFPDVSAGVDSYVVLRKQHPGLHVVVAFAASGSHAVARAWTYRVR
jgi:hypothetical protein